MTSLAWSAAALGGFALVVAGTIHFARRGLDRASERLIVRDAGGAAALVAIGVVLFLVGLYKA